jgi:hypothetical protein
MRIDGMVARGVGFGGWMNVRIPESPISRMAMAIGAAVAVMVAGGLIYLLIPSGPAVGKFDGVKIVAAGHAYTRSLEAKKLPIPNTVSLKDLVAGGFLKPEDIAPFKDLDASLVLTYNKSNPDKVLMHVRMPDGTDYVLLGDGTTVQVPR